MALEVDWWDQKKRVQILNDTEGWATPFCAALCDSLKKIGFDARLTTSADGLENADITFLLGCTKLVPLEKLKLSRLNLVVHASDLPKGRGFSPLKWQIEQGRNEISVTLFEAEVDCDTGQIFGQKYLNFKGHELLDEMQSALGAVTNKLCLEFISSNTPPQGRDQVGEPSYLSRRGVSKQVIDVDKSIAEQFWVFRTVDNDRFPALFSHNGHTYEIEIRKSKKWSL